MSLTDAQQQVAKAETYLKKRMGRLYQFGFDKDPVGWLVLQNESMDLWQTAESEEKWRWIVFTYQGRNDIRAIKAFQGTDLI